MRVRDELLLAFLPEPPGWGDHHPGRLPGGSAPNWSLALARPLDVRMLTLVEVVVTPDDPALQHSRARVIDIDPQGVIAERLGAATVERLRAERCSSNTYNSLEMLGKALHFAIFGEAPPAPCCMLFEAFVAPAPSSVDPMSPATPGVQRPQQFRALTRASRAAQRRLKGPHVQGPRVPWVEALIGAGDFHDFLGWTSPGLTWCDVRVLHPDDGTSAWCRLRVCALTPIIKSGQDERAAEALRIFADRARPS